MTHSLGGVLYNASAVAAGTDVIDRASYSLRGFDVDVAFHLVGTKGSGTSLDVVIQDSFDGETWFDLLAFTQLTADGDQRLLAVGSNRAMRFIRVKRTNVGTWGAYTVFFAGNPIGRA